MPYTWNQHETGQDSALESYTETVESQTGFREISCLGFKRETLSRIPEGNPLWNPGQNSSLKP